MDDKDSAKDNLESRVQEIFDTARNEQAENHKKWQERREAEEALEKRREQQLVAQNERIKNIYTRMVPFARAFAESPETIFNLRSDLIPKILVLDSSTDQKHLIIFCRARDRKEKLSVSATEDGYNVSTSRYETYYLPTSSGFGSVIHQPPSKKITDWHFTASQKFDKEEALCEYLETYYAEALIEHRRAHARYHEKMDNFREKMPAVIKTIAAGALLAVWLKACTPVFGQDMDHIPVENRVHQIGSQESAYNRMALDN